MAWRVHLDNLAYETLNPLRHKTGWHPRYDLSEMGLAIFAILGAATSLGASIGSLTKNQFQWTVIAGTLAFPFVLIVLVIAGATF